MCRAAQEAGAPHCGYIDKKKVNVIFTPLFLGDTLSHWNQIWCRVSSQLRGGCIANLKEIAQAISELQAAKVSVYLLCCLFLFFVILRTCKNCYKIQTHTPIALQFGTQKGSPKANLVSNLVEIR